MAQAFVSTYRNHYRWYDRFKTHSKKPVDKFAESLPFEGRWYVRKAIADSTEDDIKRAREAVYTSNRRILYSTYQMCYPPKKIAKAACGEGEGDTSFEDQLLDYCRNLFSTKDPELIPPLDTSKRICGYLRPARMQTPLTDYQVTYGQTGYNILNSNKQKKMEEAAAKKREAEAAAAAEKAAALEAKHAEKQSKESSTVPLALSSPTKAISAKKQIKDREFEETMRCMKNRSITVGVEWCCM